jgi:integrase
VKAANFSAERIAKFKCKPGKRQTFFRDGKTPGLGLRVTAAGTKTYIFETRLRKHSMRVTIGDERTWSIIAAQQEATRLKTLTDKGLDPRKLKAEQEAAEQAEKRKLEGNAMLIDEAWKAYIDAHKDQWGQAHIESHRYFSNIGGQPKKKGGGPGVIAPGILRPILNMRMKDLTASILTDWLKKEVKRKAGTARTGILLFRTFWLWCDSKPKYKPLIDAQLLDDKDFRAAIPPKRHRRFDVLERDYLKPWFAAVRAIEDPVRRTFLQALILTGARRDEMAALRWEHVDFQWKNIKLKDKVDKQGRKIPLTPYLHDLLNALPRASEWVFHSDKAARGYIKEPRKSHMNALKVAKLKHVTIHGLRRTFASLAEWLEMPQGVIAQIMGHKPSATAERHYIHRSLGLLAVWHNQYEAWILKEAGVKFLKKRPSRKTSKSTRSAPVLRLVSSR